MGKAPQKVGVSSRPIILGTTKAGGRASEPCSSPATERMRNDGRNIDDRIVEWLHRNPIPSDAGRCGWCGRLETPDATLLPFGTHSECWGSWYAARRAQPVSVEDQIQLVDSMVRNRPSFCLSAPPHKLTGRLQCPLVTGPQFFPDRRRGIYASSRTPSNCNFTRGGPSLARPHACDRWIPR